MDILRKPTWWIPALLFALHQVVQYGLGWKTPVVDDFLDPLLCFPVAFGLLLVERRWLFGVRRLTLLGTVISAVLLAVIVEFVFPLYQPAFVFDPLDFVAYAVGTVYFYYLINPPPQD